MRKRQLFSRRFLCGILILSLSCLSALRILASSEVKEPTDKNLVYVESIRGKFHGPHFYDSFLDKTDGKWSKNGIVYESGISELKAVLRREQVDTSKTKSCISIQWKTAIKQMDIDGPVSYIRWRPNHSGFIYSLFDEGSGGDFGTSSLHSVNLNFLSDTIQAEDIEITSHEIDTDLGWSNSGEYFAYAAAASLRIKNFTTGKTWAAKQIVLSWGKKVINLKEGNPNFLGGFIWKDQDRKLIFFWKDYPLDDGTVGWGEIDVSQFGLE